MFLMAHVRHWMVGEGLDAAGLTPDAAELFLAARRAAGYTRYLSLKGLAPLLGYLRRLGAAPPRPAPASPVQVVLERYQRYLLAERGLAVSTCLRLCGPCAPVSRAAGHGWAGWAWRP